MVVYEVPGPQGSKGPRRLNWVWYINIPQPELPSWLVSTQEGSHKRFSVPRGMLWCG